MWPGEPPKKHRCSLPGSSKEATETQESQKLAGAMRRTRVARRSESYHVELRGWGDCFCRKTSRFNPDDFVQSAACDSDLVSKNLAEFLLKTPWFCIFPRRHWSSPLRFFDGPGLCPAVSLSGQKMERADELNTVYTLSECVRYNL